MSNDEKIFQIGQAAQQCEAAKIECAHIDEKIESVALAYRSVGASMGRAGTPSHQPRLEDGKLSFGYGANDPKTRYLLSEAELLELIRERESLQLKLAEAQRRMNSLGIVNLG